VLLGACAAVLLAQSPPGVYQPKEEKLPAAVAPQLVPFSHRVHAEAAAECKDCHTTAQTKDQAGLPQPSRCMLCHRLIAAEKPEIRKLAGLAGSGERVRWVRVYQVPDFVFFSHKNHLAAGEQCETCHGLVAGRDVLAKEVSTSMTACMNCHAARGVSNDCHFCHALGF
jgi:hypothetical protein